MHTIVTLSRLPKARSKEKKPNICVTGLVYRITVSFLYFYCIALLLGLFTSNAWSCIMLCDEILAGPTHFVTVHQNTGIFSSLSVAHW